MHMSLNVKHSKLLVLHPLHSSVCCGASWIGVTAWGGFVEVSNSVVVACLVTKTSVAAAVAGSEK